MSLVNRAADRDGPTAIAEATTVDEQERLIRGRAEVAGDTAVDQILPGFQMLLGQRKPRVQ